MVETLITGLILAAISGLTFLAYKHPKAFKVLSPALWVMYFISIAGIGGWIMGTVTISSNAAPFIPPDKYHEFKDAVSVHEISFLWLFVINIICWLYLLFLDNLPKLINHGQDEEADKKNLDHKPES